MLKKPLIISSTLTKLRIKPLKKRHRKISYISCFRVTQIKTYSWDNAQVILVGNKCDMEEERVVSAERGRQLADQLGVEFYETSAKENINVKVFNFLLSTINGDQIIGYKHIKYKGYIH